MEGADMTKPWVPALALSALIAGCAAPHATMSTGAAAREQVIAAERAFAKTMADRDLKAFGNFVSQDTVFFSGPTPLHGKQAVIDFWSRFYAQPAAPFSWEPEQVEVLDSGSLALSSGPVRDAKGQLIGCFSSIWRQEAPGQWRVVFDKGGVPADCEKK
jgi:ketosteroid isomerase-like protein